MGDKINNVVGIEYKEIKEKPNLKLKAVSSHWLNEIRTETSLTVFSFNIAFARKFYFHKPLKFA